MKNCHLLLKIVLMACLFCSPGMYAGNDNRATVNEAQQQSGIVVSGTVTDENGETLIGVTVSTASKKTTVTDIDGRYSINANPGEEITFSYVGFTTQKLAARATLNVKMTTSSEVLDDVVVVAYGKQKKVSITAAIATVDTRELKQSPQANLSASLAGRMPGLTALQTSGQPGADEVQLYLRGNGTLNDSSPLIMIDGVPRDNIATLDPNEVATISILKDASATAVFGVRGANGVILITTRRGEAGKSELNVSANYGIQSFISTMDRVHSWDYAALRNQAYQNDARKVVADADLPYTQWMIDRYKSGVDPVFFPDRDVISEYFKTYAPQTRLNANFNGGSGDFTYFLNVGYIGQGGNFKQESKSDLGYDPSFNMKRYTFRGNVDYKIANNLKASLSLGTYLQRRNSPSGQSMGVGQTMEGMVNVAFVNLWSTPSVTPGPLTVAGNGVPAGQIVQMNNANIPSLYGVLNRGGYLQATDGSLNSSFTVDWGLDFITKGLSFFGLIAFDTNAGNIRDSYRFYNEYTYTLARQEGETSSYVVAAANRDDAMNLSKSMSSNYYLNYQFQLNWARKFGKHNLTAMAMFQRDNWNGDAEPYNMLGYVGRATYNFDDRYLAEFNIGYNGTEQFAPSKRMGVFPAFSFGWVVSNEAFMQQQKLISNLKLRASYGVTGNDKMGDSRFVYFDDIYTMSGGFASVGHGGVVAVGRLGNPEVQWEVSKKKNFGIDLEFLNAITFTADYYTEHRDKILLQRTNIPVVTGLPWGSSPVVNIGVVDNHGWEVELGYKKVFNKDFSMITKANASYNKNKVVYADIVSKGSTYVYPNRDDTHGWATGYSIGQLFGYMIDYSNGNGYINTEEELASLPRYDVGGGQPRLGDFKYIDYNGDGVINDRDMVPMGYPVVPQISYGLNGTFNYKNFDLSLLFSGIGRSSIYLSGLGVMESGTQAGAYTGWHLRAWTAERYANGEQIDYPALTLSGSSSQVPNNHFILNRAFLRLKNLEIGYTLPAPLAKKLSVKNARVYVNGNNLFTWDKYPIDTIDPEQSSTGVYGLTRMINFGVNITF